MDTSNMLTPKFSRELVQRKRKDGYWIETFRLDPEDTVPGLIAYGLATGEVSFFDNPLNNDKESHDKDWDMYTLINLDSPVAVTLADVAGNGRTDVIICYQYGPDMIDCDPDGGCVGWLENPGRDGLRKDKKWPLNYIGHWPSMHRLKSGYFTQRSFLEIIAMPIVHGPRDRATPLPVLLFRQPDKVEKAIEWSRSVINDSYFSIIHDAAQNKFLSHSKLSLESLVVASREGINLLYYNGEGEWAREKIGDGVRRREGQVPEKNYWGSECVAVGRSHHDEYAYIATLGPFHGTTLMVYSKAENGIGKNRLRWNEHTLDVFGTPEQIKDPGNGPCHHIVCADFDKDGVDEFLVALFGPAPHQGVYYYKPVDLVRGIFYKWKVAEQSAARIAHGDFTGNGNLDFATIVYNVPGYFEAPNPQINMYYNEIFTVNASIPASQFTATYWDNETLLYVPRPDTCRYESMPLLEIANYRVELCTLPPGEALRSEDLWNGDEAIRVLYGGVEVNSEGTTQCRRAINGPWREVRSAKVSSDAYRAVKREGALLLRFLRLDHERDHKWKHAEDVPVKLLEGILPKHVQAPNMKFNRVTADKDFFNLRGLLVRFWDQTPLGHLQFWTAGIDVDCGMHDHNDEIFEEIHLCLSPGTGNGGMKWLDDPPAMGKDAIDIPEYKEQDLKSLVLGELDEHGPLWFKTANGDALRRSNGTVCYPWHKWQSGDKSDFLDVWFVFEYNPDLSY